MRGRPYGDVKARAYAGIENPLFFDRQTSMILGDAKSSVADIVKELQEL